ncbi:hypothetical protein ACSSS7_000576 [Eimeria intestinalis]
MRHANGATRHALQQPQKHTSRPSSNHGFVAALFQRKTAANTAKETGEKQRSSSSGNGVSLYRRWRDTTHRTAAKGTPGQERERMRERQQQQQRQQREQQQQQQQQQQLTNDATQRVADEGDAVYASRAKVFLHVGQHLCSKTRSHRLYVSCNSSSKDSSKGSKTTAAAARICMHLGGNRKTGQPTTHSAGTHQASPTHHSRSTRARAAEAAPAAEAT